MKYYTFLVLFILVFSPVGGFCQSQVSESFSIENVDPGELKTWLLANMDDYLLQDDSAIDITETMLTARVSHDDMIKLEHFLGKGNIK